MAEGPRDACFNSICKMVNIALVSYPLRDFIGNVSALLSGRWKPLLVIIELYR